MHLNHSEISRAASLLQAGELVALPTETVYGLGADAANPAAVGKIFAAKGRPADHPLIVHLADAAQIDDWACEIPDFARQLAAAFWPGPLTLILKKQDWVPPSVTGGQDTVGLRVPSHPVAQALLAEFGGGVAAPSANRFGRISPTTAAHVYEELGDAVSLILDGGPCAVGIESTIVDCSRGAPVVLRPGHITPADINQIVSAPSAPMEKHRRPPGPPRVSGSLSSHYAPKTPAMLVPANALTTFLAAHPGCAVLPLTDDPERYARELYAALRRLDACRAPCIAIEAPPEGPRWQAVHDRLRRATHQEA